MDYLQYSMTNAFVISSTLFPQFHEIFINKFVVNTHTHFELLMVQTVNVDTLLLIRGLADRQARSFVNSRLINF